MWYLQISCECFQILNEEGERKGTFHEYENPGPNAVWNEAASSASHKLHRYDPRIVNVKRLPEVWERFSTFIKSNVGRHAWNAESCDMRWIYQVAQAPNTTLSLPDEIQYFFDPFKVISQYRSCKLNKSKSFIESFDWVPYVLNYLCLVVFSRAINSNNAASYISTAPIGYGMPIETKLKYSCVYQIHSWE